MCANKKKKTIASPEQLLAVCKDGGLCDLRGKNSTDATKCILDALRQLQAKEEFQIQFSLNRAIIGSFFIRLDEVIQQDTTIHHAMNLQADFTTGKLTIYKGNLTKYK